MWRRHWPRPSALVHVVVYRRLARDENFAWRTGINIRRQAWRHSARVNLSHYLPDGLPGVITSSFCCRREHAPAAPRDRVVQCGPLKRLWEIAAARPTQADTRAEPLFAIIRDSNRLVLWIQWCRPAILRGCRPINPPNTLKSLILGFGLGLGLGLWLRLKLDCWPFGMAALRNGGPEPIQFACTQVWYSDACFSREEYFQAILPTLCI